jgi:HEAT repeat protein
MLLLGRKPTRIAAARAIKAIGREAVSRIITGIEVAGVYTLMLSAGTVAEALKEIDPDPVESLLKILKSDNMGVQQSVMLVLRALGLRKAVTPLVELLADHRFRLRIFVVRALGGIRGVKATRGLIIALDDRNMRVRMETLQQLRDRIESAGVKDAISECQRDRSKHVRALAREIMMASIP